MNRRKMVSLKKLRHKNHFITLEFAKKVENIAILDMWDHCYEYQ